MALPRFRPSRWLLAVALLAVLAVMPDKGQATISYYHGASNTNTPAGAVYNHGTTRVWDSNEMNPLGSGAGLKPTRIWIYRPGIGYWTDTGYAFGPLFRLAPAANATIWCQNWGSSSYHSYCWGNY